MEIGILVESLDHRLQKNTILLLHFVVSDV